MAATSILSTVRRYSVVVFFPTFAVSTIYADWSHTRRWKLEQKLLKEKSEELPQ